MQALVVKAGQARYCPEWEQPLLEPGEALIRVTLAGICATDLEIVKGYAGFEGVLGHEFVGVVEEVLEQTEAARYWLGRRVVGTINLGCGKCSSCLGSGVAHCPQRRVLGIMGKDGVFADYITLPLENLLPVPDEVTDQEAVFTEPLAAALRIREQVLVAPSSRVGVVGPGRLGLLAGQVLALSGTRVTMLGRREQSLELPSSMGLQTALVDQEDDNSFDLVVEATGNEAGLAHALRLVRPLGTLVMKSTFKGQATVDLTKLVVAEIRVFGSRCGPFPPALRLLSAGAIATAPLVEAEYPLPEGEQALSHAGRSGVLKVLLRP